MKQEIKSAIRPFLPVPFRKAVRWLSPRAFGNRITVRMLEGYARRAGVGIALFDPSSDLLKVPQSAAEMIVDLDRSMIADALPWLPKVERYVPDGAVVVDVGAYRGITAQWFARKAHTVYAFEPMPENVASIRTALALRGIPNVEVIESAICDSVGERDLYVCEVRGHNSLGPVRTSRILGRISVRTTTLDRFSEERELGSIDFLKIDVEGFELEVFRGAARVLGEKRIRAVLFEISRMPLKSLGKTAAPIHELLQANGYRVLDLEGRGVDRGQLDDCEQGDFLALPEAP